MQISNLVDLPALCTTFLKLQWVKWIHQNAIQSPIFGQILYLFFQKKSKMVADDNFLTAYWYSDKLWWQNYNYLIPFYIFPQCFLLILFVFYFLNLINILGLASDVKISYPTNWCNSVMIKTPLIIWCHTYLSYLPILFFNLVFLVFVFSF